MTEKARKLTKTTQVLESLRQDIANGLFLPGDKLQMEKLKEQYGVGYGVLREALSRLVTTGLVQLEEQCGFCVTPLSIDELYDLYHIRAHIECLALELSMKHGDDRWEADVVASWYRYRKYLNPKTNTAFDAAEWDVLQKEFRTNLVIACQSPWLLKIREMLFDQASRYRLVCLSTHYKNKKILLEFIKENEELVEAVLARDKKKAVKLLQANWKSSADIIAEQLKNKT